MGGRYRFAGIRRVLWFKEDLKKIFCGEYTFSYPKFGASISQIEDIGEVMEDLVDQSEPFLEGVTIVGVKDLFSFKTCLLCKHKIALTPNIHIDDVITCKECNTAQRYTNTSQKMMAKLLLTDPSVTPITLVAPWGYAEEYSPTATTDDITPEALLKVKPFNVTYSSFHVITNISRWTALIVLTCCWPCIA